MQVSARSSQLGLVVVSQLVRNFSLCFCHFDKGTQSVEKFFFRVRLGLFLAQHFAEKDFSEQCEKDTTKRRRFGKAVDTDSHGTDERSERLFVNDVLVQKTIKHLFVERRTRVDSVCAQKERKNRETRQPAAERHVCRKCQRNEFSCLRFETEIGVHQQPRRRSFVEQHQLSVVGSKFVSEKEDQQSAQEFVCRRRCNEQRKEKRNDSRTEWRRFVGKCGEETKRVFVFVCGCKGFAQKLFVESRLVFERSHEVFGKEVEQLLPTRFRDTSGQNEQQRQSRCRKHFLLTELHQKPDSCRAERSRSVGLDRDPSKVFVEFVYKRLVRIAGYVCSNEKRLGSKRLQSSGWKKRVGQHQKVVDYGRELLQIKQRVFFYSVLKFLQTLHRKLLKWTGS